MYQDELELAGRIIPKAKRRDNFGSNSQPLGVYFGYPAACGGVVHFYLKGKTVSQFI
jgi:hypothetical protein